MNLALRYIRSGIKSVLNVRRNYAAGMRPERAEIPQGAPFRQAVSPPLKCQPGSGAYAEEAARKILLLNLPRKRSQRIFK
jgi:hypothetical protein